MQGGIRKVEVGSRRGRKEKSGLCESRISREKRATSEQLSPWWRTSEHETFDFAESICDFFASEEKYCKARGKLARGSLGKNRHFSARTFLQLSSKRGGCARITANHWGPAATSQDGELPRCARQTPVCRAHLLPRHPAMPATSATPDQRLWRLMNFQRAAVLFKSRLGFQKANLLEHESSDLTLAEVVVQFQSFLLRPVCAILPEPVAIALVGRRR